MICVLTFMSFSVVSLHGGFKIELAGIVSVFSVINDMSADLSCPRFKRHEANDVLIVEFSGVITYTGQRCRGEAQAM